MTDIQAIIHVHDGKAAIARSEWPAPATKTGIETLATANVTTVSSGLTDLSANAHVIADGSSVNGALAQNPVMVLFTEDGTDYAARGFVPFGTAASATGTVTKVVTGLDDSAFAALWALTAAVTGTQSDLDGLPAATRSIAYGTFDDISNNGGSAAALDYADALDGDD